MKILITGATGFIGTALCNFLQQQNYNVVAVSRRAKKELNCTKSINLDFNSIADWEHALEGVDAVVHLAGRSHVKTKELTKSYTEYAEVNIHITKLIIEAAKKNNVKKFIYMSSIKVNGEQTFHKKFTEQDTPNPQDYYGKSKLETENMLWQATSSSDIALTIIRAPLIYGQGVKANFKRIISLSQSKFPIPLGSIHNKRSLLYLGNLIDFIKVCLENLNANNQVFLVSDDTDISTTELMKNISQATQNKLFLVPIPITWLAFILNVIGKKHIANRLCNNLQVDITKAKTLLNWKPPYTLQEGIRKTVKNK